MIYEFYEQHKKTILITAGIISLFMLFFYGLGSYPLIDVDETRYVSMAREMLQRNDWNTLYFNHQFFFEKPPLYFWIVASGFKLFGISELSARFFIALIAVGGVGATYYFAKKSVSESLAIISAAILSTSFFYLMLAHIAILDMVLSVCIMCSVFSGFLTLFVQDENKKYFWWAAYFFSALAVLAKGIPGLAIPALSLFIGFAVLRKLDELFKPVHLWPGIGILALFTIPWHVVMCKIHGSLFFNEYVIKHHIARFVNSANLGRKQPFLFYVPIIIGGIFPWTFILISYLVKACRHLHKKIKFNIPAKLEEKTRFDIVTKLTWCYVLVTFLFFSVSSTKLPTYVLPLFAPLSILLGGFWHQYLYENKNNKGINAANIAFVVFLTLGAIALIIVPFFLKPDIAIPLRQMSLFVVTLFLIFAGAIYYFNKNQERELVFCLYLLFTVFTVFVCINDVTKIVVDGGENQLIEYAKFTRPMKDVKLVTYNFGVRPSVVYYSDKTVQFLPEATDTERENLKRELASRTPIFVIVKNKTYNNEFAGVRVIKEGKKYTLLSN